jgi:hypothetical protein
MLRIDTGALETLLSQCPIEKKQISLFKVPQIFLNTSCVFPAHHVLFPSLNPSYIA